MVINCGYSVKSLIQAGAMKQSRSLVWPPCRCADFSPIAQQFGVVTPVGQMVSPGACLVKCRMVSVMLCSHCFVPNPIVANFSFSMN